MGVWGGPSKGQLGPDPHLGALELEKDQGATRLGSTGPRVSESCKTPRPATEPRNLQTPKVHFKVRKMPFGPPEKMAPKVLGIKMPKKTGFLDILIDFWGHFSGWSKNGIFRTLKCTFGVLGFPFVTQSLSVPLGGPFRRPSRRKIFLLRHSALLPLIVLPLDVSPIEIESFCNHLHHPHCHITSGHRSSNFPPPLLGSLGRSSINNRVDDLFLRPIVADVNPTGCGQLIQQLLSSRQNQKHC